MPLIANKVAEKDIRTWLSDHGFSGQSAKFGEIELHAIQSPGWLQVFRFDAEVKRQHDQSTQRIFGAMRDDERYNRTEICVFTSFSERAGCLNSWSEGLKTIRQRNFERPQLNLVVFVPALVLLFLIILTALLINLLN